ncbi:MAG: hypothetical protein QOF78_994 [Phycisphaerales bacterium]|jgi:GH25 family lysozyme M1 (1,4-beta-N-acetylmuramidase)|nr:hypothetical protein [Phycisphaerales bacterium]
MAVAVTLAASSPAMAQTAGNRVLGVDVSDWQQEDLDGNALQPIDWPLVHKPVAQGGGGKDFAFIRASRGGTTGTYNKYTAVGTLSQKYDDYRFYENINNATTAGVIAGPYHFIKADITSYVINGQTVTHTGADEANHFLAMAGPYMRPGYLLPVGDIEAGSARTRADLSQFVNDFANRIYAVKGIRPLAYINQNYAINEVDATVASAFPNLWMARWPNQANPGAIDVQNGNPAVGTQYGGWQQTGPGADANPWRFWQYASTGKNIPGLLGDRNGNTDLDVAHGDIEYVKDFLVPALWTKNVGGDWSTISNWNTDADISGIGPAARLPNGGDNIVLDRPSATVTITMTSGAHLARKLATFERLDINGGSLDVARQADINSLVNLNAGFLKSRIINVGAAGTIKVNAGQLRPESLVIAGGFVDVTDGGSKTLHVNSLAITAGGKLDLNHHKLIVDWDPASPGSPKGSWNGTSYTGIEGLIDSANHDGAWDGFGITTSQTNALRGLTTLGVADASDVVDFNGAQTALWHGQAVDATSVLVLYTYAGDANLDGMISGDDYSSIDFNVGVAGARSYFNGDFNYDGIISGDDYSTIDFNFAAQSGPAPAALTAVPEPSAACGFALFSLASGAFCRRRRRRRSENDV